MFLVAYAYYRLLGTQSPGQILLSKKFNFLTYISGLFFGKKMQRFSISTSQRITHNDLPPQLPQEVGRTGYIIN